MRLPTPLSRHKKNVHKNTFGHVLVLAGSKRMLGAGALTSLAAMRAGAGLATLGIPKSLNAIAQKKISPVVMTLPLAETREQTLSGKAFLQIKKVEKKFQVLALGPGLSQNKNTQKLILDIIGYSKIPLVIDADALNALSKKLSVLQKSSAPYKILTPHPGEMARLNGLGKKITEQNREKTAKDFAKKYECTLLLKGHRTVVADSKGRVYINKTGNAGMATGGCGDVLTGIIAAFLAQGLSPFDAAKYGAYVHGLAGDLAAAAKTKISLIATDLIDKIPLAFKKIQK